MTNQVFRRENQQGSAIVWILIFIVLFAALSYVLSRGFRAGEGGVSDSKAKLAATEILSYTNALHTAVKTALINGCTENQINFKSAATGNDYNNTNAPSDNHCDIFDPKGGGLIHASPPESVLTYNTMWNSYRFVGRSAVQDVGTSLGELYLFLRTRSKAVCMKYNEMVGVENPNGDAPVDTGFQASPYFIGTYSASTTVSGGGKLDGKLTGCHKDSSETDTDGQRYYDLYQVLIAR